MVGTSMKILYGLLLRMFVVVGMLLWICHRHKGVAVACFSAGLAATILVGSAAVKTTRYQPLVVVRYCDLGDIAKRRPELFKGVSTMADTSKATTKLEMQQARDVWHSL